MRNLQSHASLLKTPFRAAWKTLKAVIADEQLFEAVAVIVLHTWNQKLEAHTHVHVLVAGGGPSLTGDRRWINSRRPHVKQRDGRYLCDSEGLKAQSGSVSHGRSDFRPPHRVA